MLITSSRRRWPLSRTPTRVLPPQAIVDATPHSMFLACGPDPMAESANCLPHQSGFSNPRLRFERRASSCREPIELADEGLHGLAMNLMRPPDYHFLPVCSLGIEVQLGGSANLATKIRVNFVRTILE